LERLFIDRKNTRKDLSMATETITLGDATFTLAPINFKQYAEAFFDAERNPIPNPDGGLIVAASLANADSADNPPFEKIRAGDVIKLIPAVLRISGLQKEPAGEAQATEDRT
jgi:hypothetical protein